MCPHCHPTAVLSLSFFPLPVYAFLYQKNARNSTALQLINEMKNAVSCTESEKHRYRCSKWCLCSLNILKAFAWPLRILKYHFPCCVCVCVSQSLNRALIESLNRALISKSQYRVREHEQSLINALIEPS